MVRSKASPEQVELYLKQCLEAKEKGLEVRICWTTYRKGYPEGINAQGHVVSHNAGMGQVTVEVLGFNLKKIPEVIMLDRVTQIKEVPDPAELHKEVPRQGEAEAEIPPKPTPTKEGGKIKEGAPSRLRPPAKTGLNKKK